MTDLFTHSMESPIGRLLLVATGKGALRAIHFAQQSPDAIRRSWTDQGFDLVADDGPCAAAATQLKAYFQRQLKVFELELDPLGTAFQKRVWSALTTIDYGDTKSYRQVATMVGNAKSVRAVGAANGRNPIPIVIPCHRVIGSDGTLTGYAGGLEIKRRLLDLEEAQTALFA